MTTFQNKLDEMEKRYKADTEKMKARIPKNINDSSSSGDTSFDNSNDHMASSDMLQNNTASSRVTNSVVSVTQAVSSAPQFTRHAPSQTANSLNLDLSRFSLSNQPVSSSAVNSNNLTSSSGDRESRAAVAMTSLGLPVSGRGSMGNLTSGLSLSNKSTKRCLLPLPCVFPPPNSADSEKIEQRYGEIMKQAGILTINGQKIESDINELEAVGELGHGTCGHVVKMFHKKTNQVMAVKQMRRSGNFEDNKRIIMDLDVVMKSHNCSYIVHCIGMFITKTDVWICMELMATCLDKLLKEFIRPIPEIILGKVTVATVNALHYLKESHGVIHRDVKPSNILLDERGRIKLCDFGISGHLVDSKAKTRSAGCVAYMAPERIDPPDPKKPDYDIRADVWSLGLSLVELATGEFPYKNCRTDIEMCSKILHDEQPTLPVVFSMDFRDFVTRCLTKNFEKRPKYRELLGHNFVKRYTLENVDVATWYKNLTKR